MIASSIWNSVSSPRSLMPCSRAVAMFMCVSSVVLRAVSSGSAVMAAFRFAAFDVKSLCKKGVAKKVSVRQPLVDDDGT